jgi:hypothetical protein
MHAQDVFGLMSSQICDLIYDSFLVYCLGSTLSFPGTEPHAFSVDSCGYTLSFLTYTTCYSQTLCEPFMANV